MDLEIEAISTTRVDQALHTLTAVRGMEDHNVNIVTPLQALLVCNDFMADDIAHINKADSDRRRQRDGFTRTAVNRRHKVNRDNIYAASDAKGATDAIGASDASGASDAKAASGSKSSRQGNARAGVAGSSTDKSSMHFDHGTDKDEAWADCWVRPCMYVEPPSDRDFDEASAKASLSRAQRHAMAITGRHRLVLVRGPPGTGKTQMSSAVIDAWTRNLSKDEIVIAAGPSNTATDNLLDRIADIKGRDYRTDRLGEGSSVFDPRRIRFSFTEQATRIEGRMRRKPSSTRPSGSSLPRDITQ